jgi:Fe-Mn family superoxide dismutase
MYEHSYHMDFGAKAATYVDTFMEVIRWQNVDRLLAHHRAGQGVAGGAGQ